MKKWLAALIILTGVCLLFSCKIGEYQAKAGPTVYTGLNNFIETTVTLHKGQWLKMQAKVTSQHIIVNGTWTNGVAHPGKEAGAPAVNKTINTAGESATVGPFSTAGTFQLYCTVHSGMNLTVIVK